MKKVPRMFLFFFLMILMCNCTNGYRFCEAFRVEKALFVSTRDTITYYNNMTGDSVVFVAIQKQINEPESLPTDCDCDCHSWYELLFQSLDKKIFNQISYFLLYNSERKTNSKEIKNIQEEISVSKFNHTYRDFLYYSSDLSNISHHLIDNIELDGTVYSNVIRMEDNEIELYLARDYGIVQIRDKTNNETWSHNKLIALPFN